MSASLKSLLLTILTLSVPTAALVAQPFSIDENGNGIDYLDILASPPFTAPLPFTVGPDPSRGIVGAPVLIYSLPMLVTAGDVGLVEPGQSTLSDLIRFYNAPGANHSVIIFYSDIDGPDRDLADVGIPYSASPVLIDETSAAGNNGVRWDPTFTAGPGYFSGPRPTFSFYYYTIISDVPEPGATALLLSGAGIWFWIRCLCRRRTGTMASRDS